MERKVEMELERGGGECCGGECYGGGGGGGSGLDFDFATGVFVW
jgi:hypothetical protein